MSENDLKKFLEDEFSDYKKKVIRVVGDWLEITANQAAFNFAPLGATGALRDSIIPDPVRIIKGRVIALISSRVLDSQGENYAEKQSEEELRHVSRQPFRNSFSDAGNSGSTYDRYDQGYKELKDSSPKFKTEFLKKAFFETEQDLQKRLENL